jgi:hypothetical protein
MIVETPRETLSKATTDFLNHLGEVIKTQFEKHEELRCLKVGIHTYMCKWCFNYQTGQWICIDPGQPCP